MDSGSGAIWRAVVLLSLWAGAGCGMQVCVENISKDKGGTSCGVQLLSSTPEVDWYRGADRVVGDHSHSLLYGGSVLEININSHITETVYTGRDRESGHEATVDVRPSCGFTGVTWKSDGSCQRYQTVKCILTGLFLAICLSALITTFYLCREKSSPVPKKRKLKSGEDAIYSDLKEVTSEGDQAKPGPSGQGVQAGPSGSSEVTVEAEVRPRRSLKEQAEAEKRQSLREEAEAEQGSTQAETQEDPAYTSLKKRPEETEYQLLRPEGHGSESAVTYTAVSDEVAMQKL